MAEPEARRASAAESRGEDSRGIRPANGSFAAAAAARLRASGPLGWAVFGLGVVAAILLVAAELSNLRHTTVITASCHDLAGPDADKCSRTGGQQHSYALILLALLLLVMTWGAVVGRARAAALAMIAIGAAVLVIAIANDLPDTRKGQAWACFPRTSRERRNTRGRRSRSRSRAAPRRSRAGCSG